MIAQHVVNGSDRPVEFGPWPHVGGGQVWTQTAFPCDSLLLAFIGSRHGIERFGDDMVYVMINNPIRHVGNIAFQWTDLPWERFITSEQLQVYLHEHHYQYEGQCHDLIWNRDRAEKTVIVDDIPVIDHEGNEVPAPGAGAAALDALRRFPMPPTDRTAPEIDGERWTARTMRWWNEIARPIVGDVPVPTTEFTWHLCGDCGQRWGDKANDYERCPACLTTAADALARVAELEAALREAAGVLEMIENVWGRGKIVARDSIRAVLKSKSAVTFGVDRATGPDRGGFLCGQCGFASSDVDTMIAHDCPSRRPRPVDDEPDACPECGREYEDES